MQKHGLKMKDIDLLQVFQKTKETRQYAPWLKYAIPPLVITVILTGIYGILSLQNQQIGNEIEQTKEEIKTLQDRALNDPDADVYKTIQNAKSQAKLYEELYTKISSYPVLKMEDFDAIANSAYGYVDINSLTYNSELQVITLQIETMSADGSQSFIRRLKESETFANVTYSGYSSSSKTSSSTIGKDSTSSTMTPEELLTNTNDNNTQSTYDVYTSTVLCTLK